MRDRIQNLKLFLRFAAMLLALNSLAPAKLFAGGEEVLVVYNSNVPESKSLAEYYAQKRGVPANQLLGVAMTKSEDVSRKEYDEHLQQPLLKKLESAKLWQFGDVDAAVTNGQTVHLKGVVVKTKIRYVVLC